MDADGSYVETHSLHRRCFTPFDLGSKVGPDIRFSVGGEVPAIACPGSRGISMPPLSSIPDNKEWVHKRGDGRHKDYLGMCSNLVSFMKVRSFTLQIKNELNSTT